jgi:hypothetical protein
MAYRYSDHNLLQEPNTYMYPPFEGDEFLNEYFSSRLERLVCLDANSATHWFASFHAAGAMLKRWVYTNASANAQRNWIRYCVSTAEVFPAPEQIFKGALSFCESKDTIQTLPLLSSLVADQVQGPLGHATKAIWYKAVQRFEVTKRLYEFYGPDLKKGHGEHTDLRPYALLSLSCALHYSTTGSLVALSAQLKLNDVLCSLPITQQHKLSPDMLNLLLCSEIAFVDELVHRKGIDLGS